MNILLTVTGVLLGLLVMLVAAHFLLIELGREVVVVRTQDSGGEWNETRLWIVDHDGNPWLHSAGEKWEQRFKTPGVRVELVRDGTTGVYLAYPDRSQHAEIDLALRKKYGFADRWVRLLAPCDDTVLPVRLERTGS